MDNIPLHKLEDSENGLLCLYFGTSAPLGDKGGELHVVWCVLCNLRLIFKVYLILYGNEAWLESKKCTYCHKVLTITGASEMLEKEGNIIRTQEAALAGTQGKPNTHWAFICLCRKRFISKADFVSVFFKGWFCFWCFVYLLKEWWKWRDDLVVKSTGCSLWGIELGFQHPYRAADNCL